MSATAWFERHVVEQALVEMCARYDEPLAAAYAHHFKERGHLTAWLDWSVSIGLVDEDEEAIWRRAMVLRNAICLQQFSIVLRDIICHTERLRPVVDALPARIARLDADSITLR